MGDEHSRPDLAGAGSGGATAERAVLVEEVVRDLPGVIEPELVGEDHLSSTSLIDFPVTPVYACGLGYGAAAHPQQPGRATDHCTR